MVVERLQPDEVYLRRTGKLFLLDVHERGVRGDLRPIARGTFHRLHDQLPGRCRSGLSRLSEQSWRRQQVGWYQRAFLLDP
ncbi:hypothetical protein D3C87_1752790 [compost metagenome]